MDEWKRFAWYVTRSIEIKLLIFALLVFIAWLVKLAIFGGSLYFAIPWR